MDTGLLRAFRETADAGALSRAARRLSISKPSLTVQILRLEAYFGAPLFERSIRGMTLTDAGRSRLPRARRILDDLRDAEAALRRDLVQAR